MVADTSGGLKAGQCLGYNPNPTAGTGTDWGGTYGFHSMFYTGAIGTTNTYVNNGASYNPTGPDARHLGTANVAFADGHVKAMNFTSLYNVPSSVSPATSWRLWYPSAP